MDIGSINDVWIGNITHNDGVSIERTPHGSPHLPHPLSPTLLHSTYILPASPEEPLKIENIMMIIGV